MADLVGVSRPYIVARIEAGDIPLHQQVGKQRRFRQSAVMDWHRQEQTRRRKALGQLGADLGSEIFAGWDPCSQSSPTPIPCSAPPPAAD